MKRLECDTCPNSRAGMLCNLPPEELDDFQQAGVRTVYRPRQVIFSEGGPPAGLYFICRGTVKLYHSDRFGRDHILEIAGKGAVLGELTLDASEQLSVSAEALTESQLAFLSRERLVHLLEKRPATGLRFIEALSRELARARQKARDLALKSAEGRLAKLLLELARENGALESGGPMALRYSRREIAEMIGVSTETAIRLISRLKDKKVIAAELRDLTIADPLQLARIAHHDNATGR